MLTVSYQADTPWIVIHSLPFNPLTTVFQSCIDLIPERNIQFITRPVTSGTSACLSPANDQITRAYSVFLPCFVESHFPKMHFMWAMSLYSCTISHEKICPFHRTHGLNRPACVKIFPFISMPNDVTGLELGWILHGLVKS